MGTAWDMRVSGSTVAIDLAATLSQEVGALPSWTLPSELLFCSIFILLRMENGKLPRVL